MTTTEDKKFYVLSDDCCNTWKESRWMTSDEATEENRKAIERDGGEFIWMSINPKKHINIF